MPGWPLATSPDCGVDRGSAPVRSANAGPLPSSPIATSVQTSVRSLMASLRRKAGDARGSAQGEERLGKDHPVAVHEDQAVVRHAGRLARLREAKGIEGEPGL